MEGASPIGGSVEERPAVRLLAVCVLRRIVAQHLLAAARDLDDELRVAGLVGGAAQQRLDVAVTGRLGPQHHLLLRCARMHNHILHKRRLSTYDFLFLTLLYHSNHISFHALSRSVSIFLFKYDYLHLFLHTQYGKYHKLPSAYRLHFHLYVHTDNYKLCTHRLSKYGLLH